jgi:hypothetical protein
MSTSIPYIDAPSNASVNSAATAGWFPLMRSGYGRVGFQVNLLATGAPIGTFAFDVTDDVDPTRSIPGNIVIGPTPLILSTTYASATYQPTDGAARNVLFDFAPAPTAKWMRMRYVIGSAGSAAAHTLLVGLQQF